MNQRSFNSNRLLLNYEVHDQLQPYNYTPWRNMMPPTPYMMRPPPYIHTNHMCYMGQNNIMPMPPNRHMPQQLNFNPNYYNNPNYSTRNNYMPNIANEERYHRFQQATLRSNRPMPNNNPIGTISEPNYIVGNYLRKIGKFRTGKTKQAKKVHYLKICEAKNLQKKAKGLTCELKELIETSSQTSEAVKPIQEELKPILETLSNKEIVEDLKKKIERRRKKRNRQKRRRQINYENRKLLEENIAKKNREIGEWLEVEKSKLQKKSQDKDMQKQLDAALSGLCKEQNTIKKYTEVINLISKLKSTRLHILISRGQNHIPDHATNEFTSTLSVATDTLSTHRKLVKDKISSLTLLIEAEQSEAKHSLERAKLEKERNKEKGWEEERRCLLFGKQVEVDAFNLLWPVQELHKQAEVKLENLIQYRKMWDQYLNNKGTNVPYNYVEPVAPSSKPWEDFMAH